ncbi:MAG TPA: acyl carrier protein [Edaphobacter sp.]|nr:acyl carrier protein [Edaphobacter sp.]
MTDNTIQDRVLKVIATTKRIPLEDVRPDSSFESLEIDSLDRLNILFGLESEFDIEINDEDAKHIENIPQMVEGITHLIQVNPKTSSSPGE